MRRFRCNWDRDLTTGEAALLCGVSQHTIIRHCESGKLSSYRLPGQGTHRARRIPCAALADYLETYGLPTDKFDKWLVFSGQYDDGGQAR